MQQEVMSYMEASENLIVELGITGAFSQDFVSDVEANIDNKEKLTHLITNSFYDTYEYLVKNNKEDLSLLVLAGTWIEAMYISCNISETVYHNPDLVNVILHQKSSLDKLIELLSSHNAHETIQSILTDLQPIKNVYDQIDETGITESQLNQIINQTTELRNKLIS
jgi:meiotically up-regulated gene 157 (Mug157) protein